VESSGPRLSQMVGLLKKLGPLELAASWDNVGLLVEPSGDPVVSNILFTIDLTSQVLQAAVKIGSQLVVSYHPPLFSALKRLTMSTPKERLVVGCLENGIAVYVPHTSLDVMADGMTDWLVSLFQPHIQFVNPITKVATTAIFPPLTGNGRLITLTNNLPLDTIINMVKKYLGLSHLRVAKRSSASSSDFKSADSIMVGTIGVVCGSGSSILNGVKVDLFLTGEMSHHDILAATESGTSVILCEHSNSERGFLKVFAERLSRQLQSLRYEKVRIELASDDHDPITIV